MKGTPSLFFALVRIILLCYMQEPFYSCLVCVGPLYQAEMFLFTSCCECRTVPSKERQIGLAPPSLAKKHKQDVCDSVKAKKAAAGHEEHQHMGNSAFVYCAVAACSFHSISNVL